MVNRYITALLVVLAATGMEAQTYQQALKFALTDIHPATGGEGIGGGHSLRAQSHQSGIRR